MTERTPENARTQAPEPGAVRESARTSRRRAGAGPVTGTEPAAKPESAPESVGEPTATAAVTPKPSPVPARVPDLNRDAKPDPDSNPEPESVIAPVATAVVVPKPSPAPARDPAPNPDAKPDPDSDSDSDPESVNEAVATALVMPKPSLSPVPIPAPSPTRPAAPASPPPRRTPPPVTGPPRRLITALVVVAVVCAVIAAAWWNRGDTTAGLAPDPVPPATAVPVPPPAGRVVLDQDTAPVGSRLTVRLTGWAPGSVLVRLCGNDAARGSVDCANGVTTYLAGAAPAAVTLAVGPPPVACPCVVQVTDLTTASRATQPFQPTGLPQLPTAPAVFAARPGAPEVVAARLTGPAEWRDRWSAWFGGPAHRTLELTLRNPGTVPLATGPVAVTVGRGDPPTTLVATPDVGTLAPGEERTFRIRVTLGAPTYGTYHVQGELPDGTRVFLVGTETVPWGLVVIAALLLCWLALPLLRAAVRFRKVTKAVHPGR